jgi:hypothetical protein
VTVEKTIPAPIDEVFDWLATTTNYTRSGWVLRARLARPGFGAPYGVGAVRLHTWTIGWFRERITAYEAPHSFDYLVERSVPAARHEGGRMTFSEVPGGTRVQWSTTAGVPFGAAFEQRVVRPVLTRVFTAILDAARKDLSAKNAAPKTPGSSSSR